MKVLILSSSKEDIDDYYLSISRSISNYLAKNDFDLVFGGCSKSMMGICYQEFMLHNRNIYSYTTEKYLDDIPNLEYATHVVCNNTFDMKKEMFKNSDVIVALAGGIGTLSEITSYIEENRSNDKDKPIIIYDEDKYYKFLYDELSYMKDNKFISGEIKDYVSITTNSLEFKEAIDRVMYEYGRKVR